MAIYNAILRVWESETLGTENKSFLKPAIHRPQGDGVDIEIHVIFRHFSTTHEDEEESARFSHGLS